MNRKTSLYESHLKLGARMMSFAGWQMPLSYKHSMEEHINVRKHGGLFDVSHMGQLRIKGKDSLSFLEKLVPTDVASLPQGKAQYSVFCNEEGGLIDDLIIYCLNPQEDYLLCVNAATLTKDREWIESHGASFQVTLQDESSLWGLIAIQGPRSLELCSKVFPSVDFEGIKRFHFSLQEECLFSRTGYTGEEGFEIYIPWDQCLEVWTQFIQEGSPLSVYPTGFAARDSLRLEMGYLLSGQDFDESCSLLEAGLGWLVKSSKDYFGKNRLLKEQKEGVSKKIQGFLIEGGRGGIPRKGDRIVTETGDEAGWVTSGAKSPSLEKMIGLAYIKKEKEEKSSKKYFLDVRGSQVSCSFVSGSFLKKGE